MIQMRMGQDDRINFADIKGKWLIVEFFERPGPLKQTAIDEYRLACTANFKTAAGHRASGTVKFDGWVVGHDALTNKLVGDDERYLAIPEKASRDAAEKKLACTALAIGTHYHIAGFQCIDG